MSELLQIAPAAGVGIIMASIFIAYMSKRDKASERQAQRMAESLDKLSDALKEMSLELRSNTEIMRGLKSTAEQTNFGLRKGQQP